MAAFLLAGLKEKVGVTGFSGGLEGERVQELLEARGARADFVPAQGKARINVVLTDMSEKWQTTITAPGVEAREENERELVSRVAELLKRSKCLVLGGSLPAGCSTALYRKLVELASQEDIPCVVDSSGGALRAALEARPTAVKPIREEVQELLRIKVNDQRCAFSAAKRLANTGIRWVVITLGSKGLVVQEHGKMWYAPAPSIIPKSTVGAGDAVLAGLAFGLARGLSLVESVRWGLAIAAAVMDKWTVLEFEPSEVEKWLDKVELFEQT